MERPDNNNKQDIETLNLTLDRWYWDRFRQTVALAGISVAIVYAFLLMGKYIWNIPLFVLFYFKIFVCFFLCCVFVWGVLLFFLFHIYSALLTLVV